MTHIELGGSCLCGALRYELRGEVQRFYHCHCSRCRKTTGTGHASNLLITPATSLHWVSGGDLLATYRVPEAQRFRNCFCPQCGSPLPRVIPELDAVLVPAGTLDGEPPVAPQARIFWDSRAQWSCADEGLPRYPEYP
jgi:hypothetical protein